jgi:hypothetical protein
MLVDSTRVVISYLGCGFCVINNAGFRFGFKDQSGDLEENLEVDVRQTKILSESNVKRLDS